MYNFLFLILKNYLRNFPLRVATRKFYENIYFMKNKTKFSGHHNGDFKFVLSFKMKQSTNKN